MRRSVRPLLLCLSVCGVGAGLVLAVVPSGVVSLAGRPAKPAAAAHLVSGTAPNLPAPNPHPAGGSTGGPTSSFNWSGYADTSTTDGYFTKVVGSWTVPQVICNAEDQLTAEWVGIDGYSDATVEQDGTISWCFEGTPTYFTWYEMYPAGSVTVGTTVQPGDAITASITRAGTSYTLALTDSTRSGDNVKTTKTCPATTCLDTSVEWVDERPAFAIGIAPLAQHEGFRFVGASASGGSTTNGAITAFPYSRMTMVDATESYPLTNTGPLNGSGNAFTQTWLNSY